ncbi:DNA-binding response regulator [Streptomyces sp. NPDC059258]|uniref:DNA-binding response regulator n=1 Tax=unclassified Streptomyces TaxID=2593676 RepID=UPI00368803D4
MGENEMSVFGIPEAEEEIYRHFLRNPGTRADDLRPLPHSRPGEARDRIARLQELGLLHAEDAERRIFPVDPESALTLLMAVRLAALHRELRRVTRSRHVIDGLRAELGGARSGAGTAAPRPSGIERRVLVSMCTVGKDEAGARELGVSVRTYRRHVADLIQTLGAASRAQAALLARERGWI